MAKVAIPTRTVKCKDGSTDVYVELNSNSNADDEYSVAFSITSPVIGKRYSG